jgi:hypothetical protein
LDEELPYWSNEIDYDFRLEYEDQSMGFPTPRDLLSNDSPYMSVKYMNDHLASLISDYDPNPNLVEAATDNVNVKCDRDNWRKLKTLNVADDEGNANEKKDGNFGDLLGRNALRGNNLFAWQTSPDNNTLDDLPAACKQQNFFTRKEDQEEWIRLCRELPSSTSVAERLALLAERNCHRLGNPRSDASELVEHMKMTLNAPKPAFECFHRPDRI